MYAGSEKMRNSVRLLLLLLLLVSSHKKTIPVSLPSTPFVRTDPTDTANSRGHRECKEPTISTQKI